MSYATTMSKVHFTTLGMLILGALAVCSACNQSKNANGEPCIQHRQCISEYCQSGYCANKPDHTGQDASFPVQDAGQGGAAGGSAGQAGAAGQGGAAGGSAGQAGQGGTAGKGGAGGAG